MLCVVGGAGRPWGGGAGGGRAPPDARTKGMVGKWPICLQGDGPSYLRGWTYVGCGYESRRMEELVTECTSMLRTVNIRVNF
jgi:hypothetical protein